MLAIANNTPPVTAIFIYIISWQAQNHFTRTSKYSGKDMSIPAFL